MTGNYFSPNAGDSIIVRLKIDRQGQTLAQITTKIVELSGILGAIDIVRPISKEGSIRDFSIYTNGPEHAEKIVGTLRAIKGVELIQHSDKTFLLHHGGKIEVTNKQALKTRDDLSMAYTPGVGKVCSAIHKNPEDVYKLTIKKKYSCYYHGRNSRFGTWKYWPYGGSPSDGRQSNAIQRFCRRGCFSNLPGHKKRRGSYSSC